MKRAEIYLQVIKDFAGSINMVSIHDVDAARYKRAVGNSANGHNFFFLP